MTSADNNVDEDADDVASNGRAASPPPSLPFTMRPQLRWNWKQTIAAAVGTALYVAIQWTRSPDRLWIAISFPCVVALLIAYTYTVQIAVFSNQLSYRTWFKTRIMRYSKVESIHMNVVCEGRSGRYAIAIKARDGEDPLLVDVTFYKRAHLTALVNAISRGNPDVKLNDIAKRLQKGILRPIKVVVQPNAAARLQNTIIMAVLVSVALIVMVLVVYRSL